MAKVRKKIKRPITRLWRISVGAESGNPVVFVHKGPVRGSHGNRGCIRACTAKAAGRRFIRKNLAHDIASNNYETDNQCSSNYYEMKPEWVKRFKKKADCAVIRVVN